MKSKIIILLSLAFIFAGCTEPNVGPDDISKGENVGYIDLDNPVIGQTNSYVRFIGNGYFSGTRDVNYHYRTDTLSLRVVAVNENYITIEESISIKTTDFNQNPFPEEMRIRYHIYSEENQYSVRYDNSNNGFKSNLFFKEDFKLPKNTGGNEFPMMKWKVVNNTRALKVNGILRNTKIHRAEYDLLNVLIDDTPTAYDGPGRTHIYNSRYFMVRAYSVNPWTNSAIGWDLIRHEKPEFEKDEFNLATLKDTEWVLTKINTPQGIVDIEKYFQANGINIEDIELEFENELNFKCEGGCVKIVGNYTTNSNKITFNTISAESLTCQFGNELNIFLQQAFEYSATTDELILKSGFFKMHQLIFERD